MTHQYYYFVAGLPNLGIDDTKNVISEAQFLEDARKQLSESDMRLLGLLRLPPELDNLVKVIYEQEDLDTEGREYSAAFWEEYSQLLRQKAQESAMPEQLPGIVKDFTTAFNNAKPDSRVLPLPDFIHPIIFDAFSGEELAPLLQTEHRLLSAYHKLCCNHQNRYIRLWSEFNRDLRNILIAINGRHHQIDFAPWLIGEGELVDKLGKSNLADFGLGKDHELFENLLRIWEQNNILYRERGYDILRWKWIDAQNFFHYFNIDRILGYWCKLSILNRWITLDPDLGKDLFQDTLDSLENSFSFPKQFNIKSKQ